MNDISGVANVPVESREQYMELKRRAHEKIRSIEESLKEINPKELKGRTDVFNYFWKMFGEFRKQHLSNFDLLAEDSDPQVDAISYLLAQDSTYAAYYYFSEVLVNVKEILQLQKKGVLEYAISDLNFNALITYVEGGKNSDEAEAAASLLKDENGKFMIKPKVLLENRDEITVTVNNPDIIKNLVVLLVQKFVPMDDRDKFYPKIQGLKREFQRVYDAR